MGRSYQMSMPFMNSALFREDGAHGIGTILHTVYEPLWLLLTTRPFRVICGSFNVVSPTSAHVALSDETVRGQGI